MTATPNDRQLIADACRILSGEELAELFTGHVSTTVGNGNFLIPVHMHGEGAGMESITPELVFEVDENGNPLSDDAPEPPEEVCIHAQIIQARDDVNSVVHCHPLHATGISVANQELKPASLDAKVFNGTVPVHDPGPVLLYSEEDGQALVNDLGDKGAALIRGHGAVTVGETVTESVSRMWLLERAAKLQIIAEQAGGAESFPEGVDLDFLRGEGEGGKPFEGAFEFLRRKHVD